MRLESQPAAIFLAALVAASCSKHEIPHDFRLELVGIVDSIDPAKVSVRTYNADGTNAISEDEYKFQVNPADLATIDHRGTLVCNHSGDGTVSLTLGPNSRTAPIGCRLVARIDASDVGRVELSAGLVKPKIRILGKRGEELNGVPLMLTSKNTEVLVPKGSELQPKNVGTATILARAGQVTQTFKVDVIRTLTPEALPLEQNRKIYFSLEPGKYELRVQLPEVKRLTAEWRSAPYCNYAATAKEHVSVCILRAKGGVVFDSPPNLMSGSTEIVTTGVTIAEVP
jgi:hypothetical protein